MFEELDYSSTPLGELILRRRTMLSLDHLEVYEIILGDEYLMSSLFTTVEIALSDLGLEAAARQFPNENSLEVLVGGLALRNTARAALAHEQLGSLLVVDYLEPVIEWHEKGLVPLGPELSSDARCRFVHGDFFRLALRPETGFDPETLSRKFHAILLDIDHSPDKLLHEQHGDFYSAAGLKTFASQLQPGGVFAMWSDDPPEQRFMAALESAFVSVEAQVVSFFNPLLETDSESTVYVAIAPGV